MKFSILSLLILTMVSCKPKQTVDTLPKDISQKPGHEFGGPNVNQNQKMEKRMAEIRQEFEKIKKEPCTDASLWKFAPVGYKSCGGPQFYTAYPIAKEVDAQKLIQEYNALESEYNRINNAMSDCSVVEAPGELQCFNGQILMQPKLSVDQGVISEVKKDE